jgi:dTDP-4-dehydrorhamnose reductase
LRDRDRRAKRLIPNEMRMSDDERPILILGSSGQVGWELQRALAPLGRVVAVDRAGRVDALADLSDVTRLRTLLDQLAPRLIVNAAAYTDVEKAEIEEPLALRINAEAPQVLGRWSEEHGVPIVHYSTDYVFDGTKGEAYVESDTPNPLNAYGRTKLAGDQALLDSGAQAIVFRVSWVYGMRGRNFLRTMQRLLAERDEVQVVDDQIGVPTWCRMIAEATAQVSGQLLRRELDASTARGVYHLQPAGETSWYGFASAICDLSDYDCRVQPVATKDYPSSVQRPAYSRLNCDKAKETLGLELPDWHASLVACVDAS